MVLVAYSDSEADEDPSETQQSDTEDESKRSPIATVAEPDSQPISTSSVKKPPQLPTSFKLQYSTNSRSSVVDDPSLHEGRQRQAPHVVGNWSSFIYLEWLPSDLELACLEQVLSAAEEQLGMTKSPNKGPKLQTSLRSKLGVRLPLHVSLSATLALTTENKDSFERQLSAAIRDLRLPKILIIIEDVRWFSNATGTRFFLVLSFARPVNPSLQKLLSCCNDIARQHGLPELYVDQQGTNEILGEASGGKVDSQSEMPAPGPASKCHISIAWTLENLETGSLILNNKLLEQLRAIKLEFHEVLVKVGNHINVVDIA